MGSAIPAGAAADLDLRYEARYAGVHVVSGAFALSVENGRWHGRLTGGTVYPLNQLLEFRGQFEAEGPTTESGLVLPDLYRAAYVKQGRDREIEIRYDADSGALASFAMTKQGKPRKSGVPGQLRTGTVDPVSALLSLRSAVGRAADGGARSFGVAVFDGRHRYDLPAALMGRDTVDIDGQPTPVLHVRVRLRPIAGFDDRDDVAVWADGGDDRWIDVLVSDDARRVPVVVSTEGGNLDWKAQLVADCGADPDQRACEASPD